MALTETRPEAAAPDAPPEAATPVTTTWLTASDHKTLGRLHLLVAFLMLGVAGVLSLAMRIQLTGKDLTVLNVRHYGQVVTLHGVLGVFLVLVPVWFGLAFAMVPLQIGARRLAFPRLCALTLWLLVAGAVLILAAPFTRQGSPSTGWALTTPIPDRGVSPGHGADLIILGLGVIAVAIVLGAVNLLTTAVTMRAPGLTLRRLPLFTWSIVVSSAVLLLATPALLGGLVLLFVDRHYGALVLDPRRAGDPQVWVTLFWFFAYPALWAMVLPALGAVSEIVQTVSGRGLELREVAFGAMAGVGVLAFTGWGSEALSLTTTGQRVVFGITSLAVLAPAAAVAGTWLLTLRHERPALVSPLLWAAGFLALFGLGLLGRAITALWPLGKAGHLSYFSVAGQHALFFLVPIVGALAAMHFWAPKLWGRHLAEPVSVLSLLAVVGGAVLLVGGMAAAGLQGMRIHLSAYPGHGDWQAANVVATIGGFVLVLGIVLVVANLAVSVGARRGRDAGVNAAWQGDTLEWWAVSPPPAHNFDALPDIRSDRPLADLRAATTAAATASATASSASADGGGG
jgi:cytochrome c oxidase subunit 1